MGGYVDKKLSRALGLVSMAKGALKSAAHKGINMAAGAAKKYVDKKLSRALGLVSMAKGALKSAAHKGINMAAGAAKSYVDKKLKRRAGVLAKIARAGMKGALKVHA